MRSTLRFIGLDVHKRVLQVCIIDDRDEGLPELQELSPGEQRMLNECGAAEHISGTRRTQVVPPQAGDRQRGHEPFGMTC